MRNISSFLVKSIMKLDLSIVIMFHITYLKIQILRCINIIFMFLHLCLILKAVLKSILATFRHEIILITFHPAAEFFSGEHQCKHLNIICNQIYVKEGRVIEASQNRSLAITVLIFPFNEISFTSIHSKCMDSKKHMPTNLTIVYQLTM